VVYLAYAHKSREKVSLHKALLFLGDVFIYNDEESTAHSLFTIALEGFTYMDVHFSRAECMLRLGELANRWGDNSKAIKLWKVAQPLFEQSLQNKDVAQIDTRLAAVEEAPQKLLASLSALHAPVEPLNTFIPNEDMHKIEEVENMAGRDVEEARNIVFV
jgi:hypothetical protein